MPDRVKEALFNILGSYYGCPSELPPLHVADPFAGSGSLGIEALSRGAARCTFVERDSAAMDVLKMNLAALGAGDEARVVRGDGWRPLPPDSEGAATELILLDPPFRDSLGGTEQGPIPKYLKRTSETSPAGCVIVLHHEAAATGVLRPDLPWRVFDERTFGRQVITFLRL
jgi:16S rRNA (guanine966-N2)-methyltransferase